MTLRTTSSGEMLHRVPDDRPEKIAGVKALCGHLPPFWSRPLDPEQGGPICPDCEESTMTTLSDLIALLTRCPADSPAMLRLSEDERDVYGLARAYLPWRIALGDDHPEAGGWPLVTTMRRGEHATAYGEALRRKALDMRDPGTAHAVVVALVLARADDPGFGGVGVAFHWFGNQWYLFHCDPLRGPKVAPLGIHEPDPIKALCLAVRHVLESPCP